MERHAAKEIDDEMVGTESRTLDGEEIDKSTEFLRKECLINRAFVSKDGRIRWSAEAPARKPGRIAKEYVMKSTPGPTKMCASQATDILSTFKAFLPKSMEMAIVTKTNVEGRKRFSSDWTEFTPEEFDAYIGLLILAGVFRCKGESFASQWNVEIGRGMFPATMSRQRFFQLSSTIRFGDEAPGPATDKLAAMKEIWDTWSRKLPLMYNPSQEVTIDERLVPFRGPCSFRQFVPLKPGRYGLKLWAICDASTHYCWRIDICTREPEEEEARGDSLAKEVVLGLSEGLRGQTVTAAKSSISFDLGQELLKRHLTVLGTLCRNCPELPPALLATKGRQVYSSKFAFTQNTTSVSFIPKKHKNELLMSTFHRNARISKLAHRQPKIVMDYNRTKQGVDVMDRLIADYSCRRNTSRWPLALFYDILDISAHNACIVWNEVHPEKAAAIGQSRRVFLLELGKALTAPTIQQQSRLPQSISVAALMVDRAREHSNIQPTEAQPPLGVGSKRKRCGMCPRGAGQKTATVCCKCGVFICKAHWEMVCKECTRRL